MITQNKKCHHNRMDSKHQIDVFKVVATTLHLQPLPTFFALIGILLALLLVPLCGAQAFEKTEKPLTITIQVEGFSETIPTLEAGKDFTAGQPVKSDPRYMVNDQEIQILANPIEQKEAEGYQLTWKTEDGTPFDWFNTIITESITVIGVFEQSDYSIRVSFNDDKTQDLEVRIPKGSSFEDIYGSIPEQPSKTGYSFVRWMDANDNSTFDFTASVTASTTVYALFSISEPDKVVAVDADFDVPKTLSGKCYIGATWGVHPAKFSISDFSGELEGCSGTGSCSLPSAAAPSYTWADYTATLTNIDIETGLVTYDVAITPPGAASPDGPRNSLGLIGYQTVSFKAEVQKNFGGYIEIQKTSNNPQLSQDNSTYSLEGAVFGIYNESGSRVAELITNSEGNTNRSPLLPVGVYTIKEESAPAGFAETPDKTIQIIPGSVTTSNISDTPQSTLIDLVLQKFDAETDASYPLGDASLKAARFKVSYYDRYITVPHLVENAIQSLKSTHSTLEPMHGNSLMSSTAPTASDTRTLSIPNDWEAKRTWIFQTDEQGAFRFTNDYLIEGDDFYYDHEGAIALPLGTVLIEEIRAPEGYLPLESPFVVALTESGDNVHIDNWQSLKAPEQVKRGDLSFVKVRQGSMERLANVPFLITSQSTGESHIIVTDENGMANTESSWTPHSQNTNAGISSNDGIWFGLDAQGNTAPVNDSLGALPYDTYLVEEQPCSANSEMLPVAFEVTISRDKVTLDLGTIDNKPFTPEIKGEVDKRQTLFASNGLFTYTVDYRSTSSTWADEFTTTDFIACAEDNLAHLKAISTPVSYGDYDGKMNIWYKTNYPDNELDYATTNACSSNPSNPDNPENKRVYNFEGWSLWEKNISTTEAQILFIDELNLEEGEYLTELAFEHGRIEKGFGTLPQNADQWNRRDRYAEDDTMENPFKSVSFTSWNQETCTYVAEMEQHNIQLPSGDDLDTPSSSSNYSPAILFMLATEETLNNEGIEFWNDASIDIYRNIELHDSDKDSVVQTTIQQSNNPLDKIISQLPSTKDIFSSICTLTIMLITIATSALVIGAKGLLHRYK